MDEDTPSINRDHLGSIEGVLKFIKEKADDIQKVVIIPPMTGLSYKGQQVIPQLNHFTMVIDMVGGVKVIMQEAAELLLNDGLLNRLKIKIEFDRAT